MWTRLKELLTGLVEAARAEREATERDHAIAVARGRVLNSWDVQPERKTRWLPAVA